MLPFNCNDYNFIKILDVYSFLFYYFAKDYKQKHEYALYLYDRIYIISSCHATIHRKLPGFLPCLSAQHHLCGNMAFHTIHII